MRIVEVELPAPISTTVALAYDGGQPTGSFLDRAALLVLRSAKTLGDIVTSGDDAFAVALAAAGCRLGRPVVVFVPDGATGIPHREMRRFGARVLRTAGSPSDAARAARAFAAKNAGQFVSGDLSEQLIVAGASVGREIELGMREVTDCLVSAGDRGLAEGMATYLGGRVRVVVVETAESAPDVSLAGEDEAASPTRGFSILVTPTEAHDAADWLWETAGLPAAVAAAGPLAAVLTGRHVPGPRTAVVVSAAF